MSVRWPIAQPVHLAGGQLDVMQPVVVAHRDHQEALRKANALRNGFELVRVADGPMTWMQTSVRAPSTPMLAI